MANHISAKKRAKQNIVRNLRNQSYISMVKTAVKKFRTTLADFQSGTVKDLKEVQTALQQAQSALGKSATKGLFHPNTVSRRVSRLSQMLKKATPAG